MISYQVFRAGIWEPGETRLLEKLVTRKSSVVDVGANIGWFTLCSATKARVVHAFEPEPTNFHFLQLSVARNKFRNVQLHAHAIGEREGLATLFLADGSNKGTHSTVWRVGAQELVVPMETLDRLFPSETIDVLKIDVEGGEPEVLSGARRMINEKRVRQIIMEWNPEVWKGRLNLLQSFDAWELDAKTPFSFPERQSSVHLTQS